MKWSTPKVAEVCIGIEINDYFLLGFRIVTMLSPSELEAALRAIGDAR